MDYRKYLIPVLVAVVAFSLGRFATPAKVEVHEVEKVVTEQSKDKNQDVNETTKETRLPDGTVIIEKTKDKKTSIHSETETTKEKEFSKVIENRPDWHIGLGYEPAIINFQNVSYSVILQRRIFSEFYAGVSVTSNKTVGVVVSIGF
jgi:hypothetical protein